MGARPGLTSSRFEHLVPGIARRVRAKEVSHVPCLQDKYFGRVTGSWLSPLDPSPPEATALVVPGASVAAEGSVMTGVTDRVRSPPG